MDPLLNFQFDPPSLQGVSLGVRGQFSKEHNTCFVYEIEQMKGIPNKPHKSISMWHRKFEQSVPGTGHAVQPAGGAPETLDIYDNLESNPNVQPIILEADKLSVEFQHPFHVAKISTKEKTSVSAQSSNEAESGLMSVSTEHGSMDYGLPGGDWNTLKDETDYGELFESKFACFRKMVDVLIESHACALIHTEISELRQVGRSRKHLLSTDGTPRTFADVTLMTGNKIIHLLEVDTSDAEQSLSTQLLVVKDASAWKECAESLKIELVRSSLRWPKKLLDKLCGDSHKGVHHPQAPAGNKGVLPPDSISGWAARVYGWILLL